MSYCINPWCHSSRQNPDDLQVCQFCGTPLILHGSQGRSYRLIQPLCEDHPYTEVFQTTDFHQRKKEVLKTLKIDEPKLVELFEQEAALLRRLRHWGIPEYRDSFQFVLNEPDRQILHCLVMEYIEGLNLEQWVQQHKKLDEATALDWLEQITIILGYIHKKNFFHRDIKPSNIIRRANARAGEDLVLIDFGTAREVTNTVLSGGLITRVSSSGYSAPEQLQQRAVPQSDFYALGRTFVYLMTGRRPSNSHLDLDDWEWQTVCPNAELISLINWLMRSNYRDRPQTVDVILKSIKAIRRGEPLQLPNSSPVIINPGFPDSNADDPTGTLPLNLQDEPSNLRQSNSTQTSAPAQPRNSKIEPISFPNSLSKKLPWQTISAVAALAVLGILVVPSLRCSLFSSACSKEFTPLPPPPSFSVEQLVSAGEKDVFDSQELAKPYSDLKQQGMMEFGWGNYAIAISKFDQIREQASQNLSANSEQRQAALIALRDPILLIFRNNAEARQRNQLGKPLYKIAVAVPLNVAPGIDMLRGAALAQQTMIDRGTNLEIVIANDRNNPDQAKQVAGSLANLDVLAVIGHYTSPNTCAALPAYVRGRLPLISPTSTATNLRSDCGADENPVFFRTVSTTEVEAETLEQYLHDQSGVGKAQPKVAAFYNSQEAFSKSLFDQFQAALINKGGSVVKWFDLSSPDFKADQAVRQVQSVDALAVFPDGQTGNSQAFDRALAVLIENNGDKPILGANTLYAQEMLDAFEKEGKENVLVNKLVMAVEWHEQCGAKTFLNEVNQTYAYGGVNRRSALTYEAVQAIAATLKPGITRSEIRSALAAGRPIPSAVTERQTISFDASGNRKEYDSRLLATVQRVGNQLKFVLLSQEQCS
ncbi:MAG TPA: bifunctional serine/threonine-protein kinase/ABC transporter substrate-binding protein [Trichocoleus sp.]|jgi:ABC-type branched-subunit amino acid transport system substrate-binding protein/tRNA A-37 threonylcarbamoyl transferase component Bud32